jgi:hypothetical protein
LAGETWPGQNEPFSSISRGDGTQLFDTCRFNHGILGGDNACEHLFM